MRKPANSLLNLACEERSLAAEVKSRLTGAAGLPEALRVALMLIFGVSFRRDGTTYEGRLWLIHIKPACNQEPTGRFYGQRDANY